MKHQTSPTFEQLLRVEESQWPSSSPNSPALGMSSVNDQEAECNFSPANLQDKKSVLSKVKERARKFRYSLSGRKKNGQDEELITDENVTPSWGSVTLMDDDDYDEDHEDVLNNHPEYLGAPMYESEAAPENLKETARQHPRAVPVVSQNHLVPNRIITTKHDQENENPVVVDVNPIKTTTPITDQTTTVISSAKHSPITPDLQKQSPSTAMSYATDKIASKIAGLSVNIATPGPTPEEAEEEITASSNSSINNNEGGKKMMMSCSNCKCSSSPQTWDKGVSVKEYFMSKLEPGDDERALSQAITDAISPRSSTTGDNHSPSSTVVEKVKGVVSSLFRHDHDQRSSSIDHKRANSANIPAAGTTNSSTDQQSRNCSVRFGKAACHPAKAHSTPPIPLSTNSTEEVLKEENQGKILQAN